MTLRAKSVDWKNAKDKLTQLREKVFVCEWRIPRDIEFDQQDPRSLHVLIFDEQETPIATGRITPEGEMGRVAVDRHCRHPEVYQKLFKALLKLARKQHIDAVIVQCELEGIDYYQRQGFQPVGTVYMDAGIPRQRMACPITQCQVADLQYTH
ncbi:GNAT family N-acetyltransferase [Neptunicella sp. SCSIO 80796]|uniref:GNAT family N-acetyltransferase n=1 Tax=Neptunicella plasticusilytica TaxID=3117012 RepID=UPI003A4E2F06